MKILHVTFEPPSSRSGGGLGIYQTAVSLLTQGNEVDYCGPMSESLKELQYVRTYILSNSRNFKGLIASIYHCSTTSYVLDFFRMTTVLITNKYDCVVVDSSRYGFVVKYFRDRGIPVIVRVHNIEANYLKVKFNSNATFANLVRSFLGRISERIAFSNANSLLFLTEEDRLIAKKTFHISQDSRILPICLQNHSIRFQKKESGKLKFLCTGSFWFGPNAEGVKWFLKEVWPRLSERSDLQLELIIAGSSPSADLFSIVDNLNNVMIFASPSAGQMAGLFSKADIFVAPIFVGSGMKVKIAEALSYGLPVVSSQHAAIGYDVAVEEGAVLVCADNCPADWVRKIEKFCRQKSQSLEDKVLKLFQENYSMSKSSLEFTKIICEVVAKNEKKSTIH